MCFSSVRKRIGYRSRGQKKSASHVRCPSAIIKLESISGEILLNQEKVEVDIKSYYDFSSTNQGTFHCTLGVAPEAIQLVNNYNAAHGTSYELLPDDSYTLGGLTYTQGTIKFLRN